MSDGLEKSTSDNDPAISVVIPVYNVEKYLRECLDSVEAQTFKNFEVICVNDGSTDNSLQIMQEYAERDARFRVIDKPNGGYGHSVNKGISQARGEYLSIIEPDDIIKPHMMSDLYDAATLLDGSKAQIVKSSYFEYFDLEDGSIPYVLDSNLMAFMPKRECLIDLSKNCEVMHHHPSIWTAIYRMDFLESKGIRMIEPKGAGWADNPWFYETLLQADTIVWLPHAYYLYRQTNPDASSKKLDYHVPFDRLRDLREIMKRLDIQDKQLYESLYNRTFNYIITTLIQEFCYSDEDPEFRALAIEAMQDMDTDILLNSRQGIIRQGVKYYERLMGCASNSHGAATPRKAKVQPAKPIVTLIMNIGDDEIALRSKCELLAESKRKDFEVVLVGVDAPDSCISAALQAVAADGCFHYAGTFETDEKAYNAALDMAQGHYVQLFLPCVFPHKKLVERATGAVARASDEDVVVFTDNPNVLGRFTDLDTLLAPDSKGKRRHPNGIYAHARIEGQRPILATCNSNWVHRYLFNIETLRNANITFSDNDSESCWGFCSQAITSSETALVIYDDEVFEEDDFYPPAQKNAGEELANSFNWLSLVQAGLLDAKEYESLVDTCRIASLYNVLSRFMLSDISESAYSLSHEKWDRWDLDSVSPRMCADYECYKRVDQAMHEDSYTSYLERIFKGVAMSDKAARKQARKAARKQRQLKVSKSYKIGNAIVKPVKRIVVR